MGNYYAFLVNGALILMLGAVMPYLLKDYQLRYDQGGILLTLLAVGNLISAVLGGIVSAYTGRRAVLVFGALAFAAGYGGAACIPVPAALPAFLILSGFGWGIINNLVNVVVSERAKGDAGTINILHMTFGVGAFLGPLLVSFSVRAGLGWRPAMGTVAVLSLILAYVFLRMDLPDPAGNNDISHPKRRISLAFLKDIRFYVFMLILFFYVGSENSVNGWLTTYILDMGIADEFFARRLLSVTWIAVIAGRLLCAWLSKYLSKEVLLLAGGAGSVLFVIGLILSDSPLSVTLSVIGLGLSYAGIYPNTVANAVYLLQGSGTAGGLLFSCGGLGSTILPYLVGIRAEAGNIGSGMSTLILTLSLLTLFCVINLVISKRRAHII